MMIATRGELDNEAVRCGDGPVGNELCRKSWTALNRRRAIRDEHENRREDARATVAFGTPDALGRPQDASWGANAAPWSRSAKVMARWAGASEMWDNIRHGPVANVALECRGHNGQVAQSITDRRGWPDHPMLPSLRGITVNTGSDGYVGRAVIQPDPTVSPPSTLPSRAHSQQDMQPCFRQTACQRSPCRRRDAAPRPLGQS